MNNRVHQGVELLAPAGSPDALLAAVNNGADAVYLGLSELNARRGATNFDLSTLAEGVRYAHLRGTRIYLTANVVVLAHEMQPALSMVDAAWAAGIDAVIVQDLGLMRAISRELPEVRIHASTQVDAANPHAIRFLGSLGVQRVVLARELPFEAITACAAAGLEVETFVHGALCYSYSGQCLMSSLIGRRSANRGMCAQPCRMAYELIDERGDASPVPGRYLLSTRDLAGIAHLPRLISSGVSALKIEGRMKSPEYVAIVTGVYREALDRALADPDGYDVAPGEWQALEEAFSRGFTDAYLTRERGGELMSYGRPNNRGVLVGRITAVEGRTATVALERALDQRDTLEVWTRSGRFAQATGSLHVMGQKVPVAGAGTDPVVMFERSVAVGDRVFRVANASLLEAARRTFEGSPAQTETPVDFTVRARIGEPLRVEARAGGYRASADGPIVEPARSAPLSADAIIQHVGRLGGSGYVADSWEIELDADAGAGFSQLHRLRREALESLDELRLTPWKGRASRSPRVPEVASKWRHVGPPAIVATVWDLDVARACVSAGADEVFLRVFGVPDAEAPRTLPPGIHPLLPRVVWPEEVDALSAWIENGAMVGEIGMLERSVARGVSPAVDWPLNVFNAHTAAVLAEAGASTCWASPELSGRQLSELAATSPLPVGVLIWGRIELMIAEQCVLQAAGACTRRCGSCSRRQGWWRLRDQKGYEFPVTTDASGRSHILNSVTLDLVRALPEVLDAGVAAVRIDLTDERPERAGEIVRTVRSAVQSVAHGQSAPERPLIEPSTSGHFYRGVL